MNQLTITLFKSVLITLIVAGIGSYFLYSIGISFIPSFLLLIVFQFLFFYFLGEYKKNKVLEFQKEIENKIIEETYKQSALVTCPCDRNIQTDIPININGDNNYMCPGCNKSVSVFITTKTALATTPVTINPLETPILESFVETLKNKK